MVAIHRDIVNLHKIFDDNLAISKSMMSDKFVTDTAKWQEMKETVEKCQRALKTKNREMKQWRT